MHARALEFHQEGLSVEAQRIEQRTMFDLEMLKEVIEKDSKQ